MVDIKLVAEAVLLVVAGALIIWYIVTNYQNIAAAFNTWFEQIKELIGVTV